MTDPLLVLAAILAIALVYVCTPVFLHGFSRYRKGLDVTCPPRHEDVHVGIDAHWAGLTSVAGRMQLRVHDCPFWEGEQNCNQECLSHLP